MIRLALPVILFAQSATAGGPICRNVPYSPDNCVRALACVGDEGLFFDGQARGWDQGYIVGDMNNGTRCRGTWFAGGLFGTGQARVTCDDGLSFGVVYVSQDGITGTTIGRGTDNKGRIVQGWSGENVLQFLTGAEANGPALPCVPGNIPIS